MLISLMQKVVFAGNGAGLISWNLKSTLLIESNVFNSVYSYKPRNGQSVCVFQMMNADSVLDWHVYRNGSTQTSGN